MGKLASLLKSAQQQHSAVPALNIYSRESIRGCLLAAEAAGQPVILGFGKRYLDVLSLEEAVFLTRACSRDISVPVCLHLDHCADLSILKKAVDAGFDSVMIDGSALSLSENVALTREAVEYAHAAGVDVEAELGAIRTGMHSSEDSGTVQLYTDPEQAADFCEKTGCDALAVSIGTVHGLYKEKPCIRLDVLQAVRKATDTPLVLHGGSGTGTEMLRTCIREGITKININTEISNTCREKLKALLNAEEPHMASLSKSLVGFYKEAALQEYRDLLEVNV
ncbi:MAG: class II fructose-bisphosphate aldolase [Erysipelotrichaceae bacterium]|nr:class II fructose-bisphosphate aldolase [Erysipelotrichaceae bacterium]